MRLADGRQRGRIADEANHIQKAGEGVHTLRFVKGFLAAPGRVASVVPSSRYLAAAVAEAGLQDGATARTVVELGPGTGVVTQAILDRLPAGTSFLAIEIDEEFVEVLRKQFPGTDICHGSAADLSQILAERGSEQCDSVISGLPWAAFDDALQDQLLDAVVTALRPGGVFVTFTYLYSPYLSAGRRFRQKLHDRFASVGRTSIVWWNFPPAFAYHARK